MRFFVPGPDPVSDYQRYSEICEENYNEENNKVRCSCCSKPIGRQDKYLVNDDYYCRECAKKEAEKEEVISLFEKETEREGVFRCNSCGQKILGKYHHFGKDFDLCKKCVKEFEIENYSDILDDYLDDCRVNLA